MSVAWTSLQRPPVIICEVTPRSHKGGTEYFRQKKKSNPKKNTKNFGIFNYIFPRNAQYFIYTHTHIYIYIYTGCPGRNVKNFGRVFLMLKYTDITQNTYVQSWTVTEIKAREKCGQLRVSTHTVPASWQRQLPALQCGIILHLPLSL
jgi:hypothetical protein